MRTENFNLKITELYPSLFGFAFSLTKNREDAEDLVQECIYKALSKSSSFDPNSNLKAWLFTILRNIFINSYRRKIKSQTFMDNSTDQFVLNQTKSSTEFIPDSYVNLLEIHHAIQKLDADFKIPFEMYNSGFKYKEIADEMNLPIGTIKSRIFFARKRLMSELFEHNLQVA